MNCSLRIWFLMAIISVFIESIHAQNSGSISTLAKVNRDSITLRWVPSSVPVWQMGIKAGYVIKRYTISRDGEYISDGLRTGQVLTEQPIKPESNEFFEKLASTDERALSVQEAIYGEDFRTAAQGSSISLSQVYKDIEVRFGFALFMCDMSAAIAKAAGLSFTDRNVSSKERYAYSVSLANVPDGMVADPSVVVVDADELQQLPVVTEIQAIFLDKAVKFRWPVVFHKGIYSAYTLEKSVDGKIFKPVSELPLVNFTEKDDEEYFIYTDSLAGNNQQVSYRIRGISPFGETGPVSSTISGKGKADFPDYATIDTAIVNAKNRIIIRWRVTEAPESPVTAINVLRASNYNGPFEILNHKPLDARARAFTDENPGVSNYYQVMLKGKNDLSSYSFPYLIQTEDTEPPSPPKSLSGNIDSAGVVSIVWKKNPENDLMGYKVFRSNSPDGEVIPVSGEVISENYCHDTTSLNMLSQKIFYQVIAVDRNYNTSDFSSVLELSRPDTIPPAPAVITSIDYSGDKVSLQFEGSPSKDISTYKLQMNIQNDSVPVFIKSWDKLLPAGYEHIPSANGKNLCYTLVSTDQQGNHSENRQTLYVPLSPRRSLPLEANQSTDGNTISLHWEFPEGFNPVKTIIYRNTGKQFAGIYYTLEKPEKYFIDKNIEIGAAYGYQVLVYGESELLCSEKVEVAPASKNKNK